MLAEALKQATASGTLSSNIEFISALGTTRTGTLPTHQAGDLIVAVACNFDSTDIPSTPSGWTNISSGGVFNAPSYYLMRKVAYKVAASGSESVTWDTDTDLVTYAVFRNATYADIGGGSSKTDVTTNIIAPEMNFEESNGSSGAWIVLSLVNKNSISLTMPNPSFVEVQDTNVGTHQSISFFKAGVNYFPETVLEADGVIQYAIPLSIEIVE